MFEGVGQFFDQNIFMVFISHSVYFWHTHCVSLEGSFVLFFFSSRKFPRIPREKRKKKRISLVRPCWYPNGYHPIQTKYNILSIIWRAKRYEIKIMCYNLYFLFKKWWKNHALGKIFQMGSIRGIGWLLCQQFSYFPSNTPFSTQGFA